jgi:hypothetical protein
MQCFHSFLIKLRGFRIRGIILYCATGCDRLAFFAISTFVVRFCFSFEVIITDFFFHLPRYCC